MNVHGNIVPEFLMEDGKSSFACRGEESKGRLHDEPLSKTRSEFQRDRDRIIHCKAFRRLKHKTQVFVSNEGDHFRTRLTHSIEVAQVARSLARSLGIDEDLAESCALGHDLGHTPFAHVGEDALKEVMKPYGGFDHNDQTLRVVTRLEKKYPRFDGLNLTWETLEGFSKHNGPMTKKLEITLGELNSKMDMGLNTHASLEAQAAAIADDIAYNCHDLDDGISAGLFTLDDLIDVPLIGGIIKTKRKEFPDCEEKRLVSEVIRELMGYMIIDVMEHTKANLLELQPKSVDDIRGAGKTILDFSAKMYEYDKAMRAFLWENFYLHREVSKIRIKVFRVVQDLFNTFMDNNRCLPEEWRLLIDDVPKEMSDIDWQARVIADYIAGMTDTKALLEHQDLFDPYLAL